jgi:hypothetical protein
MATTASEGRWLAQVMHTISCVTAKENCTAVDRPMQRIAAENVVRAAQDFIQLLQRENSDSGTNRPLSPADGSSRRE